MLERIFAELGPWNWMVLGFALLTLEILTPGVFMLWIGLAALIVGALSLMFWNAGFWIWEVQVVVFLALALISAFAGKKIMGAAASRSATRCGACRGRICPPERRSGSRRRQIWTSSWWWSRCEAAFLPPVHGDWKGTARAIPAKVRSGFASGIAAKQLDRAFSRFEEKRKCSRPRRS
jgi:hypothetical protein